jgi:hypothetical protein
MRPVIPILIFVVAFVASTFSQDTLFVGAGKTISGKVVEIGTDVVKYKKPDHADGPLYNVAKSEVSSIHYSDGSRDDLSAGSNAQTNSFVLVHVADQDDQLIPTNQTVDTRIFKGETENVDKVGSFLGALLIIGAEIAVVSAMEKQSNKVSNSNNYYNNNSRQNRSTNSCCSNYSHCSHHKK